MKKLFTLLFILLTTTAYAALTVNNVPRTKTGGSSPSLQDSAISDDGTTFDVNRQAITVGDGAAGDITTTFDGDAGNDGILLWDVSEDAFQFNYNLYIDSNDVISFDGATSDANRGALTSADVQADRTWTLPDATGTIPVFTPTPTDQHCVRWEVDGSSNVTLGTTGATCAASGGNVTGTGTSVLNAVPVYSDTSGIAIVVATAGKEMTVDPSTGNTVVNGNLTVTGTLTSTSAGQAILDEGLIVNNDQLGTDADNDFKVYGNGAGFTILDVDASANTLSFDGTLDYSAVDAVTRIEDTKCIWFEDPVSGDDFKSIWANKTALDMTLTEIWCESDQTVPIKLQIDDGTPADVDSAELSCTSSEAEDTALNGDTVLAAGEELDLVVGTPTGTPTWVSICWTYK